MKQHLQLEAGEEPYVLPDPPPAAAGASQAGLSQWEPLRTQEVSQVRAVSCWGPSFAVAAGLSVLLCAAVFCWPYSWWTFSCHPTLQMLCCTSACASHTG